MGERWHILCHWAHIIRFYDSFICVILPNVEITPNTRIRCKLHPGVITLNHITSFSWVCSCWVGFSKLTAFLCADRHNRQHLGVSYAYYSIQGAFPSLFVETPCRARIHCRLRMFCLALFNTSVPSVPNWTKVSCFISLKHTREQSHWWWGGVSMYCNATPVQPLHQ